MSALNNCPKHLKENVILETCNIIRLHISLTVAFAFFTKRTHYRHDSNLTIMTQHHCRLIPISIHRLQFEKVSCDSFPMLYVIWTTTPSKLFRGCIGPAFRCTLTSRHFTFCASSWYLVCECCCRESVYKCSFFVNLLHYGMYLLESFKMLLLIAKKKIANLFKNVPFASCFYRAVPSVVFELLFTMC